MLTRTSEYALRATIYLTQREADWPIPGPQIAEQVDIPRKYLSKVLGDLVRCGLLDSAPGKRGGFRLRRPAGEIKLVEVLTPFEQSGQLRCPFGNQECGDDHPCLAHDRWKVVLQTRQRFLDETSIHDVSFTQD